MNEVTNENKKVEPKGTVVIDGNNLTCDEFVKIMDIFLNK